MPPPPPPQMPQYLTILMTERGRHYVCMILALPMTPPPSHDATILKYLNDRERGVIIFAGFWRHPPYPTPTTPQYLTILMTERGDTIIFCRILAPPQCPPSQCPPPKLPRRHNTNLF